MLMSEERKDFNKNKENKENKFFEETVNIKRVSKTTKGGRTFSLTALSVVGDGEGTVGYGKGRGSEVPQATKKAASHARRNLIKVPLRKGRTIHFKVVGRYKGTRVLLKPAAPGTGNISGAAVRPVLEKLGVKDIFGKVVRGSTTPHNVVKATFDALKQLKTPFEIARLRGISVEKVFNG